MRLFIGLEFDEPAMDTVYGVLRLLRPMCGGGNFTKRENLHLTLKFLGEVGADRLPDVISAVESACRGHNALSLELPRLGSFMGSNGERILWLGFKQNAGLISLFESIDSALGYAGFERETRPLKAHITLVRRAVCDIGGLNEIGLPQAGIPADTVTLFESTQQGGELCYKPLLRVKLK